MRSVEPAAGLASGSKDGKESGGMPPSVPDGWGRAHGTYPIPIALDGQAGQDSDEQLDDENDINSMEEDIEYANFQVSPGQDLSLMSAADHPVPDGRSSPGQETVDYDHLEDLVKALAEPDLDTTNSDLPPQADEVEMGSQYHVKHDREITGRTPAPQHKKHRSEDYDLNDSPLQEGFY
eukprot:1200840-Pyramimonas_sp.AAC.1